jgi:hypothetical protein
MPNVPLPGTYKQYVYRMMPTTLDMEIVGEYSCVCAIFGKKNQANK